MRFEVSKDVFELLPDACFGVVAVYGADNRNPQSEVSKLLQENIAECESILSVVTVKQLPDIIPYREAFRALDINPNKFMCSIEALLTRVSKGKGFPEINPIVDLGNAISLKYRLPIGAHDIATVSRTLEVRHTKPGDSFIPFGGGEAEAPEPGEVIYVSDGQVRTRRWTWRQSEIGKIMPETCDLLFPIDGFKNMNIERIIAARSELAENVARIFGARVIIGMVDSDNPVFEV